MFCPYCGKQLSDDSRFCIHCGAKVNASSSNASSSNASSKTGDSAFIDSIFIHESDRAALKALQALPGFTPFFKAFMKVWHERQFRIQNMSSKIRLSEEQMPKYYNMLPPICEKLKIDVPELYLELNVAPNAYTYGDTKPFIVLTSGLFDFFPEDLIPTVIAHECGHIVCHHTLYTTMATTILKGATMLGNSFGIGGLVSLPLQVALYYWRRCSEFSADRAAAVYDGNSEKMTDICMRFAGWDKNIPEMANKELFMKQALEYREMIRNSTWDKTLEFLALLQEDHPFAAVRAYEIDNWAKTGQFMEALKQYQ